MTDAIRLSKRLTEILGCSRSQAEQYIAGGWVRVDGILAEDPANRVTPLQQVTLDSAANLEEQAPITLILHKPAGIAITAENAADWLSHAPRAENDPSGIVALRRHLNKLALCLPLEMEASGLVVLTQDWRTERKLTEDARLIEQEYVVEVAGELDDAGLKSLNQALRCKASWQNETRLRFAIKNPQAGELRTLCETAGLQVKSVRRLRIGRQSLAGLPAGEWRYLRLNERF